MAANSSCHSPGVLRSVTKGRGIMSGLHIVCIEDDASLAEEIGRLMGIEGNRFSCAGTGEDGLRLAGAGADVIVLDRMLPDMSGLELVDRLRGAGVTTPVLMLSALGRAENRTEGLEAGVDDYMSKPFDSLELIARIRALHRRAGGQPPAPVILFGDLECHLKARTAHRQGRHVPLSPKEFDLFRYLMEYAGEVVTREMLLRDIWKLSFDPQTNVIDVSMGRLRRKLEEGFDTPVLETIRGAGYRLVAR